MFMFYSGNPAYDYYPDPEQYRMLKSKESGWLLSPIKPSRHIWRTIRLSLKFS